jgi:hypothetical protein
MSLASILNMLQQETSGEMGSLPSTAVSLSSTSCQQLVPLKDQKLQQFEVHYTKRYRRRNGNGELIHAYVRTTLLLDSAGYIDMIVSRVTPLSSPLSPTGEDLKNSSSQFKNLKAGGEGLLIASCANLHLTMDLIPAIFGSYDHKSMDLKLRFVDGFLCELLGLEPQDCITLTLGQISHPDDTLAVFKAFCQTRDKTNII